MDKAIQVATKQREKNNIFGLPRRAYATGEAAQSGGKLMNSIRALFHKEKTVAPTMEKRALLKELDLTLHDLHCARAAFEQASDPEIVEACVYEIKSAESRYSYLLRKAKETGLSQNLAQSRSMF